MPQLAVFRSDLGWFGLVGAEKTVTCLCIGHVSAVRVREAARQRCAENGQTDEMGESDWFPELRRSLQEYATGTDVDFSGYDVAFGRQTAFQQRVLAATRKIPYGKTITYGRLAARAGFPRAARAVGSVMASNPVPIIVPCHRVVGAGGRLGGYSAPQGVELKRQLLAMEASSAERAFRR